MVIPRLGIFRQPLVDNPPLSCGQGDPAENQTQADDVITAQMLIFITIILQSLQQGPVRLYRYVLSRATMVAAQVIESWL
jgi:hypothetical protein